MRVVSLNSSFRRMFLLAFAFLLAASVCGKEPSKTPPAPSIDALDERLEKARNRLETAREEAESLNKKFHRVQHDLIYKNVNARNLYLEVKKVETLLQRRREQLNEFLVKTPEMKEVTKERREAYDKLEKLRDREALILKEIKAAKWRKHSPKKTPPEEEQR